MLNGKLGHCDVTILSYPNMSSNAEDCQSHLNSAVYDIRSDIRSDIQSLRYNDWLRDVEKANMCVSVDAKLKVHVMCNASVPDANEVRFTIPSLPSRGNPLPAFWILFFHLRTCRFQTFPIDSHVLPHSTHVHTVCGSPSQCPATRPWPCISRGCRFSAGRPCVP